MPLLMIFFRSSVLCLQVRQFQIQIINNYSTMKAEKDESQFRVYITDTPVYRQYKEMRSKQTYKFAKEIKERHLQSMKNSNEAVDVMTYVEKLDMFVDKSDPDISLSNINHLYQTAERMRHQGMPDWFQLAGFIHDLGKVIGFLFGKDDEGTSVTTQWAITGDTYVLGCRLRNSKVYPELDELCEDMKNPLYSSEMGIYKKGCGLSNCVMAWGHDQFMYDVIKHNRKIGNINQQFPEVAQYIIRFHSLYPWHCFGQYQDFEDQYDKQNKHWIKQFNKFDLYSKQNKAVEVNDLKEYYNSLIHKYFKNGKLVFI